jgi:hypothetical protein
VSKKLFGLLGGLALVGIADVQRADACGCFTPPDPSVPVVQAGEKILFAMGNGQVTAHIQIQYAGDAKDFGWLLPLPSVPTMQLGTDELFNALYQQTQPKYKLNRVYEGACGFNPARFGGFGGPQSAAGGDANAPPAKEDGGPSPLVVQDSIGPYDYAVLRADSKDAMLQWLQANRYFVPAGTEATVDAYIHPNAFFLALKLKSGASAGDLQPVVVQYPSDLPMIPIVLTSTGAEKNMGIQVWMLGAGRAIPRNYYHTVLNDSLLDWLNGSQNYNDVVISATGEAPGKHSFITEYAGTAQVMRQQLNAPGRFGTQAELAASIDDVSFVQYLQTHQFNFNGQLVAVLSKYLPEPLQLANKGYSAQQFYQSYSYFVTYYRQQNPQDFIGWAPSFQPVAMAQEIQDRVVTPTLAAGKLFDDFGYLTRLYTTLSPEDMTKDPVFSYNATLPNVDNVHEGTLTYHCGFFGSNNQSTTPATLVTSEGWAIQYPAGANPGTPFTAPALPASLRIEILGEEGPPQIVTDNARAIGGGLGQGAGCAAALNGYGPRGLAGAALVVGALALLVLRRRRRSA